MSRSSSLKSWLRHIVQAPIFLQNWHRMTVPPLTHPEHHCKIVYKYQKKKQFLILTAPFERVSPSRICISWIPPIFCSGLGSEDFDRTDFRVDLVMEVGGAVPPAELMPV